MAPRCPFFLGEIICLAIWTVAFGPVLHLNPPPICLWTTPPVLFNPFVSSIVGQPLKVTLPVGDLQEVLLAHERLQEVGSWFWPQVGIALLDVGSQGHL